MRTLLVFIARHDGCRWDPAVAEGGWVGLRRGACKIMQGAMVGVLTFALTAANAAATHSLKDQISTGPTGGNGAFASTFDFSSGDGSKGILETQESLVAGDTDAEFDLYQRQGGTTT